jgi:hypothetical protein
MARNKMIAAGLTAALLTWGGVAMAASDRPRTESVHTAVGSTVYQVEEAGTVTVAFDGTALTLVDQSAADGWTVSVDSVLATEIEVDFVSPARQLRFNAEIEDGAVRVRVEDRTKDVVPSDDSNDADDSSDDSPDSEDRSGSDSGSDSSSDDSDDSDDNSGSGNSSDDNSGSGNSSDDNSGHGSGDDRTESFTSLLAGVQTITVPGLGTVTVDVQAPNVTFVSAAGADGWSAMLDENEPGEVKVLFSKDGAQMEAKIEIEDGSLRLRVETEH